MLSCLSNSELAYLDGILVASTIVVIIEGEISTGMTMTAHDRAFRSRYR